MFNVSIKILWKRFYIIRIFFKEFLFEVLITKTKSGRAETDNTKSNKKRVIELPEKVAAKCFKTE